MKTKNYFFLMLILATTIVISSCKKDKTEVAANPTPVNTLSGLGSNPGIPSGSYFELPKHISIIGDIRGGIPFKKTIDKKTYTGSFPYYEHSKNWVTYGTGTYVDLYIKFYNSSSQSINVTIPGGLIFVDSLDLHSHLGTYQKGYILQDVEIPVPSHDTAFACIQAYCLNHTLAPSSYAAIYYIGPITNNPELNQITAIMSTKQAPIGQEYQIQTTVWNVTDYGLTLTAAEIAYLNSLP